MIEEETTGSYTLHYNIQSSHCNRKVEKNGEEKEMYGVVRKTRSVFIKICRNLSSFGPRIS